jgi:hypothetical protein
LLSQRFGGNLGAAVTNSVLSGFANSSGGITTPGFGSQTQTALSQSTFIHLNLGHYYLGKKNHVLAEREFVLAQAANSHDPKF